MRDVKIIKLQKSLHWGKYCLNYAGCKAFVGLSKIAVSSVYCLNYAGCKALFTLISGLFEISIALTMRDVKGVTEQNPLGLARVLP